MSGRLNDNYVLNSEKVRTYLRKGHRKQTHLVIELDVSQSLVTQMLCDGRVPGEETLNKLAQLIGCQAVDLLLPKEVVKRTA